ncbi:hypothetical protein A2U01_0114000, partial [Trifolium medium]|nr:hypothetical protein [Trifolium medium]
MLKERIEKEYYKSAPTPSSPKPGSVLPEKSGKTLGQTQPNSADFIIAR